LHWLRATRAAIKPLRRLATQPLLRHRLLPLRTLPLLLRALLLLRAMLVLRLLPLLRTQVLLLRTQAPLLRLLLRLRAQATKHSRDTRAELRSSGSCCEPACKPGGLVRFAAGKQKSHERKFVAFLLSGLHKRVA
jgi:hypothetical protein